MTEQTAGIVFVAELCHMYRKFLLCLLHRPLRMMLLSNTVQTGRGLFEQNTGFLAYYECLCSCNVAD